MTFRPSAIWFFFFVLLLSPFTPVAVAPAATAPSVRLADVPLSVRSWEKDGLLGAEVDSRLDYPFATVRQMLIRPEAWCEFLPLVFNIKSCTYGGSGRGQRLSVYVGRKFYETPEEAYRLDYEFTVQETSPDRFRIFLFAPVGPHGTGDYRITLEASREADGRTAVRMLSSFRPSLRSQLATRTYLATSGRDKVGFSITGHLNGEPVYVGGTSGIVERNAMRYFLALKAYFATIEVPEGRRFEARLRAWFALTEKYPRQLFEMSKEEYLAGKRQERQEQLALQKNLAGRSG